MLAAVDEAAAATASAALQAEIVKPLRSIAAITGLIATLEAATPPAKPKKAVLGDWKLTFASDEAAVKPFTTDAANGPFTVLEEVYHRVLTGDAVQSIEVVRKIGPFGNSASALCGKWSVSGGSSKKGDTPEPAALTWRVTYRIDERGREVDPPKGLSTNHAAVVTHASTELLVMRINTVYGEGASSPSYVVFTKLPKGAILKALTDELSVYGPENYLMGTPR